MNIVCVLGSPRAKGNSAAIAKRFGGKAEALGAEVQYFNLNKMAYRGCQGCLACKTKLDRCVLEDDLTQVLDGIRDADVLVMATPVYFAGVTGQFKCFMDRTFSFLKPDFHENPDASRLPSGKKMVFIVTQGQPDEAQFADICPLYESIFKFYGFKETHSIRACGVRDLGEAEAREDIMTLAEETAEKIVG